MKQALLALAIFAAALFGIPEASADFQHPECTTVHTREIFPMEYMYIIRCEYPGGGVNYHWSSTPA